MPILMDLLLWCTAAGFIFALGAYASWRVHVWRRSARAKERSLSGYQSEKLARKLLEDRGIEVMESPFELESRIQVDGVWTTSPVRVDFLVLLDGTEAIIEVKSTERSANPHFPDTRRQLREYWASSPFPLYLIDVNQNILHAIDFEENERGIESPSASRWVWVILFGMVFFAGAALMRLWLIWQAEF